MIHSIFNFHYLAILAVFLPLFASIFVGIDSKKFSKRVADFVTTFCCIMSFVSSALIFYYVIILHNVIHIKIFKWIDVSCIIAYWSIYIDSLTSVMLCVVTFVSSLVHLYSIGYMSADKNKQRFMAYLSLFTFFMLILVVSDNFLQLFLGWEGVGLSSFLLISFWYEKKSASNAALKAFLVNRVGDIGLIIAIFLIALTFKSVEFQDIFSNVGKFENTSVWLLGREFFIIDLICVFMFFGCMGKSAQIGLHVWLPDAMEGPTPVSALIHAATMVTAGVFLVVRCSLLFEYSDVATNMITFVGAITCVFAASIALVQNDIKKIIAYSTCSQLGYMFIACGISAYPVAIFHLVTHAFFKALLFLGAGSVIHAVNNEQDIRKMGGLYKALPVTYILMWIGSLALAGIFPFAGYYSKDLILESAYLANNKFSFFAYNMGIVAALFTAFYSWRLIFLVFHNTSNMKKDQFKKVHESPKSMMIPMVLLAVGAIISGFVGEHVFDMGFSGSDFWNGSVAVEDLSLENISSIPDAIHALPLIMGVLGIVIAYVLYIFMKSIPKKIATRFKFMHALFFNKYYFDEIYHFIFVNSMRKFSLVCWKVIDNSLIDGFLNISAVSVLHISKIFQKLQNGKVYRYAFVMLIGMIIFIYIALIK
ncbi:MAG: NADH-quinone oxidoreductase subunit L [Candidatus Midichloriaceae bacterium]|jgi:NADH-quinone oxidoreductase subunit L